jgi:hypothetical protein
MFDGAAGVIDKIMNYSIMGISLGIIIALAIFILRTHIKTKLQIAVTKEGIEEAFKNVVLPKDLRINLSNKVVPAVQETLKEYMEPILKAYKKVAVENQLMLSIMAKFSHVEKLTEQEQALLQDLLKERGSSEVDWK